MKYILAIVFILNISVWVWSQLLPKPNENFESIINGLAEEQADSDKLNTKIETIKAYCADSYHIALRKQQIFNTVIRFLLPINTFAVFILILLLSQYKKEENSELKDSGNGVPPSQI